MTLNVYFIFILDYGNDVRQKANSSDFLTVQNGSSTETTHKINSAFSPGTAKEQKVQWWFQRLLKGDESLEDEKQSDWPLGVNNDQLRASSKLILLQLHKKLLKNPASIMLWPFSI